MEELAMIRDSQLVGDQVDPSGLHGDEAVAARAMVSK